MAIKEKRVAKRHAGNLGADKIVRLIEQYRELALDLAPIAVGLLDRAVANLREVSVKKPRTAGDSRRLRDLGLKAKR